VSASAYFQRKSGQPSARAVEDERLLQRIRVEHKRNWEAYGYRRMWKHLLREGERVPRCQIQRLMRANGIQARSGVASRGARLERTWTPNRGRICWSVTSPRRAERAVGR